MSVVFPKFPGQAYSTIKRPRAGRTITHTTSSGKETRIGAWGAAPVWEFELVFEHLRERENYSQIGQIPVVAGLVSPIGGGYINNDFFGLAGFFQGRRGSWDSFLFDDPTDDHIAQQQIATGDGNASSFQITRQIGEYAEPTRNINGTPVLCGTWSPSLPVASGALVVPTPTAIRAQAGLVIPWQTPGWPNYFMASGSGTTGTTEPRWRNAPVPSLTLVDGSVTWINMGVPVIAYLSAASTDWTATAVTLGTSRRPVTNNAGQYTYVCTTAGTSSGTYPTWPQQLGATVTDGGGVVWQCVGIVNTTVGNLLIVPQLTSAYSITPLGQLAFTASIAANVNIYFTSGFWFRCRFKDDITEFENFMHRFWTNKKVEFTSIKN